MRPTLRDLAALALCLAARPTSAQPRPVAAADARPRAAAAGMSAECRRCVTDARTCLDDGDVPCALDVLEGCRACGARRSTFVPPSHRRGVTGAASYWSGAAGEPTRAQLLALQPALREQAERCRAALPGLVSDQRPIEVGFVPTGAVAVVHLTVESIGTEVACLTSAARSALRVPPFAARHTVVVRFPVDAAAWRRARPSVAAPAPRADAGAAERSEDPNP